ncbi:GDSL-like Lipase/Acylhydrolase-domain-containing protein [Pilobolus umbonatus]|nr:GDSL-like Lipase/Acylhydrolase-domain-containing protein [Pilobolus umbonatus]
MNIVLYAFVSLHFSMAIGAKLKNLVVFGDSNSDVGNGERWSNGPLWSEYLSVGWDVKLYSFAYSGSVCDSDVYNIPKDDRIPSLRDQIEGYYHLKLDLNPEETVYAFWIGIQDIFEIAKRPGRPEPDYKQINNCIDQQLKAIRKVFSSDRFLVFNVPPLQYMPYYREDEAAGNYSQAAVQINRSLEKEVINMNKHHHALKMDYIDVHGLISDMVVDPVVFGYKDSNASYVDTCYEQSSCVNTEDDYVWWDHTHFTTAFYKSIATSILEAESSIPKKSEITREHVEKLLNEPHSKYKSKKYDISPHTDIIDLLVKQYDLDKAASINRANQTAIEDVTDEYSAGNSITHPYLWLFIFFVMIAGIALWIKVPRSSWNFMGSKVSRNRINFTVIRNEDA